MPNGTFHVCLAPPIGKISKYASDKEALATLAGELIGHLVSGPFDRHG
jgi:hypothetical protein